MDDDDKWMELNVTHQEMRLEPITEGQKVVIVIGENLNEQRIRNFLCIRSAEPVVYSTDSVKIRTV